MHPIEKSSSHSALNFINKNTFHHLYLPSCRRLNLYLSVVYSISYRFSKELVANVCLSYSLHSQLKEDTVIPLLIICLLFLFYLFLLYRRSLIDPYSHFSSFSIFYSTILLLVESKIK